MKQRPTGQFKERSEQITRAPDGGHSGMTGPSRATTKEGPLSFLWASQALTPLAIFASFSWFLFRLPGFPCTKRLRPNSVSRLTSNDNAPLCLLAPVQKQNNPIGFRLALGGTPWSSHLWPDQVLICGVFRQSSSPRRKLVAADSGALLLSLPSGRHH